MGILEEIRWRPGIGDPTVMGWATVATYLLAALLAAAAARRRRPERTTWTLVAVFMGLLCLNKQLDLQSLATDLGRIVAFHGSWYESRREVQRKIVLGTLGVAALATSLFAWRYRVFWRTHPALAVGLCFLATFIAVRAISFHHVDAFLKTSFVGVRMNWLLELGGIALVGLAAIRALRRAPAA